MKITKLMDYWKSFSKDYISYGLGFALGHLGGIITLPIYTRLFSTEEMGIIITITLVSGLIGILMSFGLQPAIFRLFPEASKEKRKTIFFCAYVFVVFIGGLFTFIAVKYSPYLSSLLFNESIYKSILTIAFLTTYIQSLTNICLAILRIKRKVILFNTLTVVTVIVSLLFVLLFVLILELGIMGVFLGNLVGVVIGKMITAFSIKDYFVFRFRKADFKELLSFGLPLVPSEFANWANQRLGRLAILYLLGISSVGIFGVTAKIATIFSIIIYAWRQSWVPFSMSILKDENRDLVYSKVLYYYLLVCISGAFLLCIFSKELISFIATSRYVEGIIILPWILGAMIIQGIAPITRLGLFISKKTVWISLASWSSVIAHIVFVIVFIPVLGIEGAAIGFFVASVIRIGLLTFWAQQKYPLNFPIIATILLILVYLFLANVVIRISLFENSYVMQILRYLIGSTGIATFFYLFVNKFRAEKLTKIRFSSDNVKYMDIKS